MCGMFSLYVGCSHISATYTSSRLPSIFASLCIASEAAHANMLRGRGTTPVLPNDVRSFQRAMRVNSELRLVVMSRLLSLGDKIDKGHQDPRRSPRLVLRT